MIKFILAVLLALGAALYFPKSRIWLAEHAQPIVNPILSTATQSEMEKIVGDLQQHARENFGRYPDRKQFSAWLESKYSGGGSKDSWETLYELEDLRRDRNMRIRSYGPDLMRDTPDDIIVDFKREGR